MTSHGIRSLLIPILALVLAACTVTANNAPVTVSEQSLESPATCSDTFVTHTLDHVTTIAADTTEMFDSNGAGLAVNDLDNDGDLDLVFANLAEPNAIFWNQGDLQFEKEMLDHGQSRGVSTVDVNGDGWMDVVFTTRVGIPILWHNTSGQFEQSTLPGMSAPAYAMNWGDLDRDGDLDLVTASYDAALEKDLGDSFLLGDGAGSFHYQNKQTEFIPTRLAETSQALALGLYDLDDDGRDDILVGNDFVVRDQAWLRRSSGWEPADLFATTTHSTMSFDAGDLDNDGRCELIATDMHPYSDDPETQAAWQPVMDMMMHDEMADDPQIMENVVQMRDADGQFANYAPDLGLNYSGWSWSTKFGDVDNDGFLDLYTVNGMTAAELFGHLPEGLLVEENQVFRNVDGGRFETMPAWQLNATDQGRGMSFADLDGDGDLDIIVNNLLSPAQLFENKLCGGASLAVDLRWPDSQNPYAIGAQVRLIIDSDTNDPFALTRSVRTNSGYLSGDPARLHFGFPPETELSKLEITWPDGLVSVVDAPTPGQLYIIERQSQP